MNYKKLILVGFISAFVAVLTSIMGVAGTIIGSVITSVLYNMLTEAFDQPTKRSISASFEWDIAYVFPIVVIALIQLLLIFALLSENGFLPNTFLNVYLSLQNFANNNLYRLLGIALLIISAYPLILKPDFVKKEHGGILAFVGLIFLARGFVDLGNIITQIYDTVFIHFDLPIAIIAFLLIVFVIYRILTLSNQSENDLKQRQYKPANNHHIDYRKRNVQRQSPRKINGRVNNSPHQHHNINHGENNHNGNQRRFQRSINKSSSDIHFESNELLDDYKK